MQLTTMVHQQNQTLNQQAVMITYLKTSMQEFLSHFQSHNTVYHNVPMQTRKQKDGPIHSSHPIRHPTQGTNNAGEASNMALPPDPNPLPVHHDINTSFESAQMSDIVDASYYNEELLQENSPPHAYSIRPQGIPHATQSKSDMKKECYIPIHPTFINRPSHQHLSPVLLLTHSSNQPAQPPRQSTPSSNPSLTTSPASHIHPDSTSHYHQGATNDHNPVIGNVLALPKRPGTTRLYIQNINKITMTNPSTWDTLCLDIQHVHLDSSLGVEHNLDTQKPWVQQCLHTMERKTFGLGSYDLQTASTQIPPQTSYKTRRHIITHPRPTPRMHPRARSRSYWKVDIHQVVT